ncbi:Transglycosylase [Solitalea koreensis]|uniref:Transglycosylase n=2 Tax=Solitalea koreensis TaxID=543615 RepID=A0A521CNK4_9SPHI|nr:Transglycosylase [Solitalea koreensis]
MFIILFFLFLVACVAAVIAYNKRESILQSTIAKVIAKERRENDLDIKINNPHFTGLSTVQMNAISVVPIGKDTLLHIHDLKVGVRILPLLTGNVKLSEVILNDGIFNLVSRKGVKNFDFLLKDKKQDTTVKHELDLGKLANRILNSALNKIPNNLSVKNFNASITDDSAHTDVLAKEILIDNKKLSSTFILNKGEATWHLNGKVNPGSNELDVKFYAEGKKVEFPYLQQKYGIKMNFDTIATRMDDIDYRRDNLTITGAWSIRNLLINHPKIASNDIKIEYGSIDAAMIIGKNYIALDSLSTIHLKKLEAHPYIKYTLRPTKNYQLNLKTDWINGQDFFDSFPTGMFESLEGIKVSGKLKYTFNFYLDETNPDSVRLDSRLDKQDFRITAFGKTNLQKINQPFVYTPYEYGKPMRNIMIGPSNPNFTSYANISPYLKNSILTAEDAAFFSHKGFYEEAFRKSIATNYKAKSFKRGGSTISMQLVKNVYLSRQKTVARKVEEMLIVWLIENLRLTSKERMFEVYLNIIEWAPNVYGVGEASKFYFAKTPAELNLGESMFLASIIPSPKRYGRQFFPDGSLKPRISGYYFNLISGLMLKRGQITESDKADMYNVELRGPARNYVIKTTVLSDSTMNEEGDENDSQQQILQDHPAPVELELEPKKQTQEIIKTQTIEKSDSEQPKETKAERRKRRKEEQLKKQ